MGGDTIAKVKSKINQLFYQGQQLKDHHSLAKYSIEGKQLCKSRLR